MLVYLHASVCVYVSVQDCVSHSNSLLVHTYIRSNFTSNRVTASGNNNVPAFYAYRSTCHFLGATTFAHNLGGGLGLSHAVGFASGRLLFEHNVAVHGAGLKLLNSAVVRGGLGTKWHI